MKAWKLQTHVAARKQEGVKERLRVESKMEGGVGLGGLSEEKTYLTFKHCKLGTGVDLASAVSGCALVNGFISVCAQWLDPQYRAWTVVKLNHLGGAEQNKRAGVLFLFLGASLLPCIVIASIPTFRWCNIFLCFWSETRKSLNIWQICSFISFSNAAFPCPAARWNSSGMVSKPVILPDNSYSNVISKTFCMNRRKPILMFWVNDTVKYNPAGPQQGSYWGIPINPQPCSMLCYMATHWSEAVWVPTLTLFPLFIWFKRRRGNTSSDTSRWCMARDGGAEKQEGKDAGVKRQGEMKQSV